MTTMFKIKWPSGLVTEEFSETCTPDAYAMERWGLRTAAEVAEQGVEITQIGGGAGVEITQIGGGAGEEKVQNIGGGAGEEKVNEEEDKGSTAETIDADIARVVAKRRKRGLA